MSLKFKCNPYINIKEPKHKDIAVIRIALLVSPVGTRQRPMSYIKKVIIVRNSTAANVDADPKVRGTPPLYITVRVVFANSGPHSDCPGNLLVHNPMKLHVGPTDIELLCCR